MSDWKAKRFWKEANVIAQTDGYSVALDGRPVKTPAKRSLVLPSRKMAEAVAEEWDAQTEVIDPLSMPFTRTANAALDKVAVQHGDVADMIADYGDSDLLCYRADRPEALINRQSEQWDPFLDWAAEHLDARLQPRSGVMHQAQDADVLSRLRTRVHALSNFELAAFHDLVSLSGSLILGFACALNVRSAADIWDLSRLDEIWQAEQWGQDEEAENAAQVKKLAFLHAKQAFDLSRP